MLPLSAPAWLRLNAFNPRLPILNFRFVFTG